MCVSKILSLPVLLFDRLSTCQIVCIYNCVHISVRLYVCPSVRLYDVYVLDCMLLYESVSLPPVIASDRPLSVRMFVRLFIRLDVSMQV